jgi:hypothetical protein
MTQPDYATFSWAEDARTGICTIPGILCFMIYWQCQYGI